jgi:hypothetical protein
MDSKVLYYFTSEHGQLVATYLCLVCRQTARVPAAAPKPQCLGDCERCAAPCQKSLEIQVQAHK